MSYTKQNKNKRKQILGSAQYGLEIMFKLFRIGCLTRSKTKNGKQTLESAQYVLEIIFKLFRIGYILVNVSLLIK